MMCPSIHPGEVGRVLFVAFPTFVVHVFLPWPHQAFKIPGYLGTGVLLAGLRVGSVHGCLGPSERLGSKVLPQTRTCMGTGKRGIAATVRMVFGNR